MTARGAPSRREFLSRPARSSAGIVLGFRLPSLAAAAEAADGGGRAEAEFAPNAFVRIGRPTSSRSWSHKAEMGQGIYTALPMLVAEELEVDLRQGPRRGGSGRPGIQPSRVRHADHRRQPERDERVGAPAPGGGRRAGDAARGRRRDLEGRPRRSSARRTGVVARAGRPRPDVRPARRQGAAPCRSPRTCRSRTRRTSRSSAGRRTGSTRRTRSTARRSSGSTSRVPGMLTAVVARPPVFGGTVKASGDAKARAVPGVRHVVADPVAASPWWPRRSGPPSRGRDALEVTWDEGDGATRRQRPPCAPSTPTLAGTPGRPAPGKGDVGRRRWPAAAKTARGRLRDAVPRPRADGAAQLLVRLDGRPVRDLDGHAVPDARPRRSPRRRPG